MAVIWNELTHAHTYTRIHTQRERGREREGSIMTKISTASRLHISFQKNKNAHKLKTKQGTIKYKNRMITVIKNPLPIKFITVRF